MKISDETKVGILTTFALVIIVLGYSFLKGNNLFKEDRNYYVKYNSVQGLNVSDNVVVSGVKIGRVSQTSFLDANGRVLVKITLDNDFVIPQGSTAQIASADLLGTKVVNIILNHGAEPAQPNDTLIGDVQADLSEAVKTEILPVKLKAEELMGSFDSIIKRLQVVLDNNTIENSLGNLEAGTKNFSTLTGRLDVLVQQESESLKMIIENLASISGNIENNNDNIDAFLANINQLSDSLANANIPTMVNTLDSTLTNLNQILDKVNNGDGSLAMLINDPQLYTNLENATYSLDSLLRDVEENPGRYVHVSVFGKKDERDKKKNKKKD